MLTKKKKRRRKIKSLYTFFSMPIFFVHRVELSKEKKKS